LKILRATGRRQHFVSRTRNRFAERRKHLANYTPWRKLDVRLIRGEMLRIREMEYADAARTVGNPTWRIVLIHLLPNCLPPLIVQATLAMGFALLTMASLSFIGLGIQPPQSEWGVMTAEGASEIVTGEWWLFLFPGLAIMITVLAFNLVGDGLRDFLDPRMRGVR